METIYNVLDKYTEEEKQYYFDDTGTQKYWVYGRLNDKKEQLIQKIDTLKNKHYINILSHRYYILMEMMKCINIF